MCRLLLKTQSEESELELFSEALVAMRSGGPDKTKTTFDPKNGILFGHNRLSIIDLSEKGDQPMEIDGNTLLFNGEIYNHAYLKEKHELETESSCDTEVILRLYNKYGTDAFDMLDGEFAIALFDSKLQKVWMLRDRLGIKQLYFSRTESDELLISSEIKGILPFIPTSISEKGLESYFLYGYTDNVTLFEGVWKTIPGLLYEMDLSGYLISHRLIGQADTGGEVSTTLNSAIKKAVEKRMMSDVPVSCTLSGGIDSSIVAVIMSNLSKDPIDTYTIGFEGCENEFDKAKKVADLIGSNHHQIDIPFQRILDEIDDIILTMEEPIDRGSLVPTYFLAKEIKQKVTLIGEGSDEIFGGYSRHKYLAEHDADFKTYFETQLKAFEAIDLKPDNVPDITDKNEALRFDLETEIPNFHTIRIDKCMMNNGVEARVPFLDPEVVRLAMLIPFDQKQNPEKKCLREAFKGELPEFVLDEPKKALKLPFDKIVTLKEVEEQIKEDTGYFPDYVIKELYSELGKKKNAGRDLWNIFLFNRWLKLFPLS